MYQETVVAYDVVLGDGSLVRVTKDNEYSDLYHCLPWSHGTLGFLVALELQIIPVKGRSTVLLKKERFNVHLLIFYSSIFFYLPPYFIILYKSCK